MILAVPAPTAVTKPLDEFTVATDELLLLQVPPAVPVLVKDALEPGHSGVAPFTVPAVTFGLTVKVRKVDAGLPHPELTGVNDIGCSGTSRLKPGR